MVESRAMRNVIRVGVIGGTLSFLWALYADHIPSPSDYTGGLDRSGFDFDTTQRANPYPEVVERIGRLEIPFSLDRGQMVNLSASELLNIEYEIVVHKQWMEYVIAEYEYVMMSDADSVEDLAKLKAAYAELIAVDERITDLKDAMAEHAAVLRDMEARGVDPKVIDAFEKAFLSSDKFPELFNVREHFESVYTAAHQISLLDEGGKVWVGGVARDLEDVWGISFTSFDERQVPRRPAFALHKFFSDNVGASLIVTEGHTGDADRPVSGYHRSVGHRTGSAFDVDFKHPETPEDVYAVLTNSTDPSYQVEYHVKTPGERTRVVHGVIYCAMRDGMSYDEAKQFAESKIKAYSWVTGGHFHIVATGGIGPSIDPEGPVKVIASRK